MMVTCPGERLTTEKSPWEARAEPCIGARITLSGRLPTQGVEHSLWWKWRKRGSHRGQSDGRDSRWVEVSTCGWRGSDSWGRDLLPAATCSSSSLHWLCDSSAYLFRWAPSWSKSVTVSSFSTPEQSLPLTGKWGIADDCGGFHAAPCYSRSGNMKSESCTHSFHLPSRQLAGFPLGGRKVSAQEWWFRNSMAERDTSAEPEVIGCWNFQSEPELGAATWSPYVPALWMAGVR